MRAHVLGPGLVFYREHPTENEILPLARLYADEPEDAQRLALVEKALACEYLLESYPGEGDTSHVYLLCYEVSPDPIFVGVIDELTGRGLRNWAMQR